MLAVSLGTGNARAHRLGTRQSAVPIMDHRRRPFGRVIIGRFGSGAGRVGLAVRVVVVTPPFLLEPKFCAGSRALSSRHARMGGGQARALLLITHLPPTPRNTSVRCTHETSGGPAHARARCQHNGVLRDAALDFSHSAYRRIHQEERFHETERSLRELSDVLFLQRLGPRHVRKFQPHEPEGPRASARHHRSSQTQGKARQRPAARGRTEDCA